MPFENRIADLVLETNGIIEKFIVLPSDSEHIDELSGIVSEDSPLWQENYRAMLTNKKQFKANDTLYKIINCIVYNDGVHGEYTEINKQKVYLTNIAKKVVIHIYCRTKSCQRKQHCIEDVAAIVPVAEKKPMRISVSYCNTCDKYFLNYTALIEFEQSYGMIMLKRVYDKGYFNECSREGDFYRRSYSKLRLYGYNLSDGMTDLERQKLLVRIIENKFMSKSEIIDWLAYLIEDRGNRCQNACIKWKQDLKFVQSYNISRKRPVFASLLKYDYKINKTKRA